MSQSRATELQTPRQNESHKDCIYGNAYGLHKGKAGRKCGHEEILTPNEKEMSEYG